MARMHGGRRPNEKAKDFKGTMKKLIRYMAIYKVQVFFVHIRIMRLQCHRVSEEKQIVNLSIHNT